VEIERAAELAVSDINAKGGVLGKPLELVAADDSCYPEQAVRAARRLAERENVSFVVGHVCSGASIAASVVYRENKIIQMTPAASAPLFTERDFNNVFRLSIRTDRMGEFIGDYLGRLDNTRYRIALLGADIDYGKTMVSTIEKKARAENAQIAFIDYFPLHQSDFGAAVTRMKHREVNVACIIFGTVNDHLKILHTMREYGHDALAVLSGSPGSPLLESENASSEKVGPVLLAGFPDYSEMAGAKRLTDRLRNEGLRPTQYSLYAYAALETFAQAATRAGNFNYERLINELKPKKNFETIVGHISFDPKGDAIDIKPIFYKLEDGDVVAMNTRPPPPPPPPY
jgi:branched-chain amino acid transport system substrate-binding protein